MFTQYQLPYGYDALEPVIDTATLETHHGKHHATYTANLNAAAEKAGIRDSDIADLLAHLDDIEDTALRTALRNNGGGFYNHNLYFEMLSPNGGGKATGTLAEAIDKAFGSFDEFKEKMSALAMGQFGSGWAWLSCDSQGELFLSQSGNQDNPISLGSGHYPLFTIDVWEHAYYLKYRNLRADYVSAIWDKIDWKKIGERYESRP